MTQHPKATPTQTIPHSPPPPKQQAPHIHTTTTLRIVTATTQVKANERHRMNAIFCETGVKSTPLYHVMLPQHLQDRAHQDTPSAQKNTRAQLNNMQSRRPVQDKSP